MDGCREFTEWKEHAVKNASFDRGARVRTLFSALVCLLGNLSEIGRIRITNELEGERIRTPCSDVRLRKWVQRNLN